MCILQGIRVEFCAENRVGLLSDITRVLRENGLAVVRADVATQGEKAVNAFYVRDISGNEVDMGIVESSMKKEMGPIHLIHVKNESQLMMGSNTTSSSASPPDHNERSRFSLGDMLKSQIDRISHNFVAIK